MLEGTARQPTAMHEIERKIMKRRPESFISIASRVNHLSPQLRERRGTEDNEKLNIK
jgi:hypothetical protein